MAAEAYGNRGRKKEAVNFRHRLIWGLHFPNSPRRPAICQFPIKDTFRRLPKPHRPNGRGRWRGPRKQTEAINFRNRPSSIATGRFSRLWGFHFPKSAKPTTNIPLTKKRYIYGTDATPADNIPILPFRAFFFLFSNNSPSSICRPHTSRSPTDVRGVWRKE